MLASLLILAMAQDADLEALVAQLDQDDASIREKATRDLAARGPGVVPRILALHRNTSSAEARSRAEVILLRYPFTTFVQTRPEEPLHDVLKKALLGNLEAHRNTSGCRLEKGQQPSIDASRLRILRQAGSGHGQYLGIDQIEPREGGEA